MNNKTIRKTMSILLSLMLLLSFIPFASAETANSDGTPPFNLDQSKLEELKQKVIELNKQRQNNTKHVDPSINTSTDETVKIIVEFKSDPVVVQEAKSKIKNEKLDKGNAKGKLKQEQDKFKTDLSNKGIKGNISSSYTHVFNGMAMEVKASDIPKLLESEEVIAVYKNNKVEAIPVNMEDNKPYMGNTVPFLGVNKVWEYGYQGKGIKVGVIDTGVDYNHPDLQAAYKGGYDFVDNDEDPYEGNELIPTTHGTHVAGIIAGRGNPNQGGVRGVAPKSDLYVYRVLAPFGGWDEWVVAGIEKSVMDGMDVINLSLGASVNNSDTPTARAVNNAMLAGVTTVIANGNSGSARTFATVSTPATASLPISVGATYPPLYAYTFNATSTVIADKTYSLQWMMDWEPTDYKQLNSNKDLVYVGLGTPEDFKGKNVKGKIVLVKRGAMLFNDINLLAEQHGAAAIIAFNTDSINEHINRPWPVIGNIPMFDMRGDDGRALVEALKNTSGKKGAKLQISEMFTDSYPGDDIVDFSSNGPVADTWVIKPDVVAPGAFIYSTVPAFNGDYTEAYAKYSGTSMAAPHVAGLAALVLNAHPEYSPFDVKAALMNTALKLPTPIFEDYDDEYSVLEMGAGRIQGVDAIETPVLALVHDTASFTREPLGESSPEALDYLTGSLNFGEIWGGGEWTKTITLKDVSGSLSEYDISYELRHFSKVSGGGGGVFTTSLTPPSSELEVDLTISQPTVEVPANGSTNVEVTMTATSTALEGIYEGFVYFTPKNGDGISLQIPFAAFSNPQIIPGIKSFTLDPKFISPNDDGVQDSTTVQFDFEREMTEGYIFAYNMLTGDFGIVDVLEGDYLTAGSHSFEWDGKYLRFNEDDTEEEVEGSSGLYYLDLWTFDKYGNEHLTYALSLISKDITNIELDEATDNILTVYSNEVKGSLRDSVMVDIAKDLYFLDQDFWNILQLKYEVYETSDLIYRSGWLELRTDENTASDEVDFILKDKLLPGENTVVFYAMDHAGMVHEETFKVHYVAGAKIDGEETELGSELRLTLSANQVKALTDASFKLKYDPAFFTFNRVEVDFMLSHRIPGMEASYTHGETGTLLLEAKSTDSEATVDGNIPALNVYFDVSKDLDALKEHVFTLTEASYTSGNQEEVSLDTDSKNIEIYTQPASITTKLHLEAYLDENGNMKTDVAYGYDSAVKVYDSETGAEILPLDGYRSSFGWWFDFNGDVTIIGLKPGKEYDVEIIYPGHFSGRVDNVSTFTTDSNGVKLPYNPTIQTDLQLAGEVNGDNEINIFDVSSILRYLGQKSVDGNYPEFNATKADINIDAIINETDLNYSLTNFGKKGTDRDGGYIRESNANLQFVTDTATIVRGDIIPIHVTYDKSGDFNGAYGMQYAFNYDPSVLQLVTSDGTEATGGEMGDYFHTDVAGYRVIENKASIINGQQATISFAASYEGELTNELKPDGTVMTYYFRWVGTDTAISSTNLSWDSPIRYVEQLAYYSTGTATDLNLQVE